MQTEVASDGTFLNALAQDSDAKLLIEDSSENEGVFECFSAERCSRGLHVERYL